MVTRASMGLTAPASLGTGIFRFRSQAETTLLTEALLASAASRFR